MMTLEEKQSVASLKKCANDFKESVRVLVELEAMKAANQERISEGLALAYPEEEFIKLLDRLK